VIEMAPHVLEHRIVLTQESRLKKQTQKDIVRMALEGVSAPIARRW